MKKKYIKHFLKVGALATISLATFASCEDNEYDAPGDVSDAAWILKVDTYDQGVEHPTVYAREGGTFSIMDCSEGCLDHSWTVRRYNDDTYKYERKGAYIITGELGYNIKNIENYYSTDLSMLDNTNKTLNLYFYKYGTYKIHLVDHFSQKTYITYGLTDKEEKRVYTKWDNATKSFVMDTTFTVHAFGSKLHPRAQLYKDVALTEPINIGYQAQTTEEADSIQALVDAGTYANDTTALEVEFGTTYYLKDITDNFPTSTTFSSNKNNITQVNDSVYSIQFNKLYDKYTTAENPDEGLSTVSMICARELSAETVEGKIGNSIGNTFKKLPFTVKVTASTVPLTPIEIQQVNSYQVRLVTSYLLDEESLADVKDVMKLKIKNTYFGSDADLELPITSTKLDPNDDRSMLITTSALIYNTDQISLEYAPTDDVAIYSYNKVGTIDAEQVNNLSLDPVLKTDQSIFGFETDACWVKNKGWFDWKGTCTRINTDASDGDWCMKVDLNSKNANQNYMSCFTPFSLSGDVPALISFDYKTTEKTGDGEFMIYLWDVTDKWWTGTNIIFTMSSDVTVCTPLYDTYGAVTSVKIPSSPGEWHHVDFVFRSNLMNNGAHVSEGETNDNISFHVHLRTNTLPSGGPIYFDNFQVHQVRL